MPLYNTKVNLDNGVTGTLQAAQFPALTGDVTTSAGSLATTLAATSNGTLATLSKSTGVAIHGTNTNDSASAGYVGEVFEAHLLRSAASGQTANITTNVATLSNLTAGDWDISGCVGWTTAATTTNFYAAISATSATLPATDSLGVGNGAANGTIYLSTEGISIASAKDFTFPIPSYRVSISGTTTFYLVQRSDGSNNKPYGYIYARRIR